MFQFTLKKKYSRNTIYHRQESASLISYNIEKIKISAMRVSIMRLHKLNSLYYPYFKQLFHKLRQLTLSLSFLLLNIRSNKLNCLFLLLRASGDRNQCKLSSLGYLERTSMPELVELLSTIII